MMKKTLPIFTGLIGSLLLWGCGSDTPDLNRVRSDLDNPTASVSDKGGIAAAAQRQASSETTADVGGTNPFGGLGLTASNAPRRGVNPMVPLEPFFQHVEHKFGMPLRLKQGLRASQADGDFFSCFNEGFGQASGSGNESSFNMSLEIDFDRCSVEGISGRMKLDMKGKVDVEGGKFDLQASYTYDALCITDSVGSICQTGSMQLEADGSISGVSFEMNAVAGWNFTATITRDGKARDFINKGGLEMKLGAGNDMASGSFRMIVYLTNDRGEEQTYTLTLNFSDTEGKFTVTGKDGTVTCSFTETSGSCSGDASVEWTDDDWSSAFDIYGGI